MKQVNAKYNDHMWEVIEKEKERVLCERGEEWQGTDVSRKNIL